MAYSYIIYITKNIKRYIPNDIKKTKQGQRRNKKKLEQEINRHKLQKENKFV